MNKKFKLTATALMLLIAILTGFTACHHSCKHDGKCGKETCCAKGDCNKCEGKNASCSCKNCSDECKKDCKQGSCCHKDGAGMAEGKACCKKDSASAGNAASGMYVCPMCKDVTSDKPGKCPNCGMQMEKKK